MYKADRNCKHKALLRAAWSRCDRRNLPSIRHAGRVKTPAARNIAGAQISAFNSERRTPRAYRAGKKLRTRQRTARFTKVDYAIDPRSNFRNQHPAKRAKPPGRKFAPGAWRAFETTIPNTVSPCSTYVCRAPIFRRPSMANDLCRIRALFSIVPCLYRE